MNSGIRVLFVVFLSLMSSHAHAADSLAKCGELLGFLANREGGSHPLSPELKSYVAGNRNHLPPGYVARFAGILVRFEPILKSLDAFEQSLPKGPITPKILEAKIEGFSDEFALLPTTDSKEIERISKTNAAVNSLIADPRTPDSLKQKLTHYSNTVKTLGLQPGLPFSNLVSEAHALIAN